jgi:hypothetical protein
MTAGALFGVVAFFVVLLFARRSIWHASIVGAAVGLGATATLEWLMKGKLKFPYLDSYENPGNS